MKGNHINPQKIGNLRVLFDEGCGVRRSALAVGISKDTVTRYFKRWRAPEVVFEQRAFGYVTPAAKEAFRAKANERGVSLNHYLSEILQVVADDDLFSAILD